MTTPSLHERTVAIQKSIETGERHPLSWFDTRTYIQHNLLLRDGVAGLLAFLDSLPRDTSTVSAVRAFTDGDVSVAHLEYHLEPMGHVVGFEVHRWSDDRVVEHWDNLQPIPSEANTSGRGMLDGSTEVLDRHLTAENKNLIDDYVRTVLIGRHVDRVERYVDVQRYAEHDPHRGDDTAALLEAIGSERLTYRRVHRILGEGNFVLTLCEGAIDGADSALYDLYRLEGGRVVEHWDVTETIPPRSQWQNDNGKF